MANKRKPAVPDELLDQRLHGSDALEAPGCSIWTNSSSFFLGGIGV